MKVLKALSSAIFLVACTSLYSQNISKYLDNGIRSEGKNILKIGYDPLNGELPLIYEHLAIKNKFSFEVGAGPVWLEKQNNLHPDEPLPIKQTGLGFTAWIRPKVYFRSYPERIYVSSYPKFTIMDKKLFIDIALLNIGYQRIVLRRMIIAAEAGLAFRFYKDPLWEGSVEVSNTTVHIQVPVMVNLGYMF